MKKILLLISISFIGQINAQCVVTVNSATICVGQQTATLTANGATSYSWAPSTGLSSTTGSAVIASPNATTSYTVTGLGCTSTATSTVTINPLPIINIDPQTTSMCDPVCVNFSNTTTATGTCNWDFGDGTTSTNCVPTHCYSTSNSYTATLTLTDNNGCYNSGTSTITVNAIPTAVFSYSLSSCCNHAYFTDSSYTSFGDAIVAWNWTFFGGYPSSSTNQNPGIVYLNYGVDTVCLTVTSSHGCKDSICKLVNENIMSVEKLNNSSTILIYPNPTSDQFYIEANTTDKLTVDLYDVNGRHVFSKSVSDKSNINVTTFNEGVYTLTIKTVDRVINKKLVIVR